MTYNSYSQLEYIEASIRITLPHEISEVIMKEKVRLVSQYGSSYKSEPHITLYLGRYTQEGLTNLIPDLRYVKFEPIKFSLLGLVTHQGKYSHIYNIDVSNKESILELHNDVCKVAIRYQSDLLREREQKRLDQGIVSEPKVYNPHITLGIIANDNPQPNVYEIQNNIQTIVGKEVTVTNITVFFYGRLKGKEIELLEQAKIYF